MRRYVRGDKVEVLKAALEHSWYPARILNGDGDAYTVCYDGRSNGVLVEVVLAKYIRPRPPVVEFSDWSRGDLVHVFENLAWKLATVLQVLEKKQFMVRVVGSMLDLTVNAARIRIRHCWQDGRWIVIGKGPSVSDVRQPRVRCNMILDSRDVQKKKSVRVSRMTIIRQKSHYVPARSIKRNAPRKLDQTEACAKVAKVSRTIERYSPCTLNQTDTCTGTGMRSRLTEEPQGPPCRPRKTKSTLKEEHQKQEDCGMSSVGSCSINMNSSNYQYPVKYPEHSCDGDVSDAESCTGPSLKPGDHGVLVIQQGRRGRASVLGRRDTETVATQS